ncbi:hypothetical protein ACSHT0_06670 [Tepidicaulis sp. LMO-SS28]|uniref:hypothetical protein n=1 Tax=Tepidicaulis sp. LMO-SS28 TaxID=3447455 RepID=UPI003EE31C4D
MIAASNPAPIDVVAVAADILNKGARRETMASQQEIRALAAAVLDFSASLHLAAGSLNLLSALAADPASPDLRIEAISGFSALEGELLRMGFLTRKVDEERGAA